MPIVMGDHIEMSRTSAVEEIMADTELTPRIKIKKSRLSLTKPADGSPEGTSRYGRARKPKHDSDDFLPTDAVLGKSPKSPKKDNKKISSFTPLSFAQEPLNEDVFSDIAYIRDCSTSLNNSISALSGSSPEAKHDKSLNSVNDSSVENSSQGEVLTEYEPGDLIWGRVGHHPFWPCIIINDPEFRVYHKTAGRGRLLYHVLFYGDNGKRSWVPSSSVLRFLGQQDFQSQASAISSDMKKKDPKLFSGFFVKTNIKQKWESAVKEAEAAMPMTRDERVDAFLRSFPGKHPKGTKKSRDVDAQDSETEIKEASSRDTSPEKVFKNITSPKQKNSPPPEKRKRGRPRKSLLATPLQNGISDSVQEDTPAEKPQCLPKSNSCEGKASLWGEDGEELNGPQIDMIMEHKDAAELGLMCFKAWNIPHFSKHFPNAPIDVVESMILQEWDAASNSEKVGWVPVEVRDTIRARIEANRQRDTSSSDDEGKYDDGAGVEEEVATVAASETEKPTAVVTISKEKVNLFRGYRIEKVCQVCEKTGNTIKCRGPCSGYFHVECARGADNSEGTLQLYKDDKPKKRGRKKKIDPVVLKRESQKVKTKARQKKIYADEEVDSDLDYNAGEGIDMDDPNIIMMMIMGDNTAEPRVSVVLEEESEEDEDDNSGNDLLPSDGKVYVEDFRCGDCAVLRTPLCFSCGQATDPSGQDSTRHRCSVGYCGKHFHAQCLKMWPQATHSLRKGVLHTLTCPQHVCHTCISDNPHEGLGRFLHEKLVRCIQCPTSYHYGNYCVPAGTKILTASQMICPRHYKPPKKGMHHVNASWCFICSVGGSLICCDLCPSSIHVECLKIKPPAGGYICEDCETGRFPLYNEVLWVKLGTYRWWPALSLFPSEVPDNVKIRPHTLGEFAVRFLGTNDHYWIHRGRCFVFHEGDSVMDYKKTNKSIMDSAFQQGVKEANELHKAHKELRAALQLQALSKPSSLKPPQYIKIKTNKAVGRVKTFELDASNISPCECDPNSDHPCSPDSYCLNRMVLQECDPNTCPAGDKCENQSFEKRLYPALEPYRTDGRGWGLKTLVDLKKGAFVIEYVGEVIDDEEYQRRLQMKHDVKDENYYFLTIDSYRIIDAGPKGNVSRFMNHSCRPNCETQKWTVAGDTRVGLFALQDIPANSELTFNYNLESKGNEKKPCMCGAAECSGFIGAKKKIFQPEVKAVSSSGKKKRRKPRVRNLIEDICLICNLGTEKGSLITCVNKDCATRYHLTCVGLSSPPTGKWLCRRHRCNLCEKRSLQWCSYCTDSYCVLHLSDLLFNDPLHGYICEIHQKNPTSIDDHKKKREEERKQKEEERKRQDEKERAQRRSRRERITTDEEVVKKKLKLSSDKGDTSETSSEDPYDPLTACMDFEAYKSEIVSQEANENVVDTSLREEKEEENVVTKSSRKKRGPQKHRPKVMFENFDYLPNAVSKELVSSSSNIHNGGQPKSQVNGTFAEEYSYETFPKAKRSDGFKSEVESTVFNESQSDDEKDDVPGADPQLDKFILKECEPMDDLEMEVLENRKGNFLKKQTSHSLTPHSPTTMNKKRRKRQSSHNQDHIKPFKKSLREMDDNMKGNLSNELQDIALTFASDDGEDSPKLEIKKARGQPSTRGRVRRTLGIRSRPADSTSKDTCETPLSDVTHNSSILSPTILKSPINSKDIRSVTSDIPPSELFARQRAKGSKVMPPTRRLSSALEVASHRQHNHDFSDRAERSGKGLKFLKGRRPSVESSSIDNKTENLCVESVQSGAVKRTRSVLCRVEDNGASVEEDMESNSTSTPKLSLSNSIISPPGKKKAGKSNSKNSSELGVNPLWNQDILNTM